MKLGEVALSDAILAAYKKSNNNNAPAGLLELEGLGERRLRRAQNVHVSFLRTSETPSISEVKNDYFFDGCKVFRWNFFHGLFFAGSRKFYVFLLKSEFRRIVFR